MFSLFLNNRFKAFFFLFISIISFVNVFAGTKDTVEIIILHVNDVHGKIEAFDKFIPYVKKLKQQHSNVIVVSSGDLFSGNPVVDQYPEKGYPMIDLMNKAGFQLSTLGNHEFDYGLDVLEKRMEQANFSFLCINCIPPKNRLNKLFSHKEIRIQNGPTLMFYGAVQLNENKTPDAHPEKLKGFLFTDPVSEIKKIIPKEKNNKILIALSHLGVDADSLLAIEIPNLDVVIGGHTHTLRSHLSDVSGKPCIVQAGSNFKYFGQLTIKYFDNKIVYRKDTLIDIHNLSETDSLIYFEIKKYNDNPSLNVKIGVAKTDFNNIHEIGNLMTDAIIDATGADIAFQNNGGIRIQKIEKGAILTKNIYQMDPFNNIIVLKNLSAEEIKNLLLFSFEKKDDLLQVSGLNYSIENSNNRITISLKTKDGKPLESNEKYKVAMNSYMANMYKFQHDDKGKDLRITTAEALIQYIKKKNEIIADTQKRGALLITDIKQSK